MQLIFIQRFAAIVLLVLCLWQRSTAAPCIPHKALNQGQQQKLVVELLPILVVDKDTNIGSGILRVCNNGSDAEPLRLAATSFYSSTTKKDLGTITSFSAADLQSQVYLPTTATASPISLPPGERASIKIEVSKLSEAGESTATMLQNGAELDQLTATKSRVPFALKMATPAGEEDGLFYSSDGAGSLIIRNDDPMTYPIFWQLLIDGKVQASHEELIGPSGATPLQVTLPQQFFAWPSTGTLQDEVLPAKLFIRLAPQGQVNDSSLASTELPVKLRLRYFQRGWQDFWNTLWIVLVLACGAAISIALNIGIPNQRKRNTTRKLIADVGGRINGLDSKVDSKIMTFLQVERSRLESRLHDAYWFSPDLAAELPLIQQAIDLLNGRVGLAEDIAQTLELLKEKSTIPPSILENGLKACQKALETAIRPALSPTDIASASATNAALQQQVDGLEEVDATFEAGLLAKESALKTALTVNAITGSNSLWSVFLPQLQEIFDAVISAPSTIRPDEYFMRDMAFQVTAMCADYVDRRRLLGDQERIMVVENAAKEVAVILQDLTFASLVRARNLLAAASKNVTELRILAALQADPPKLEIIMTPERPRGYEAVECKVQFLDSALNTDAVREQFTCKWTIGGRTKEGWIVWHYFGLPGRSRTRQGSNEIVVHFWDSSQILVKIKDGDSPVELVHHVAVGKQRRAGHIGQELTRTGLALLVALLALVAGAQTKIVNLSIVQAVLAVLVIGMTADSIKNLLAK